VEEAKKASKLGLDCVRCNSKSKKASKLVIDCVR
jgi:hypothetical protein